MNREKARKLLQAIMDLMDEFGFSTPEEEDTNEDGLWELMEDEVMDAFADIEVDKENEEEDSE